MFTLSQLSYWPALRLGKAGLKPMDVRGRMQEGMVADIVMFDPKNVVEGSGYEKVKNGLPPKGLPHVIVNRQFVKKDGEATDIMAGQPICCPGRLLLPDVLDLRLVDGRSGELKFRVWS